MSVHEPFICYVAPISGASFPSQIALMCEVSIAKTMINIKNKSKNIKYNKIQPDISLATSGGNICIYAAIAGGWKASGIYRIARSLETSMLLQSWWPKFLSFLPSPVLSLNTGSCFRPGYGVEKLFENYLTPSTVTSTEVWTGTKNDTNNKAQFFCNKSNGQTYIKSDTFEKCREIYNCEPLTYTKGDLKLIAKVALASASIPIVTQAIKIHGSEFSDGGVLFCSPLSVFTQEILRILSDTKKSLQMIYFSCYDMSTTSNDYRGINGAFGSTLSSLICSLTILDRCKGIELIRTLAGDSPVMYLSYNKVNTKMLAKILEFLARQEHYFLELYPKEFHDVNLISFEGDDVINKTNLHRLNYAARVWYIKGD
jgi:hypothetical protein